MNTRIAISSAILLLLSRAPTTMSQATRMKPGQAVAFTADPLTRWWSHPLEPSVSPQLLGGDPGRAARFIPTTALREADRHGSVSAFAVGSRRSHAVVGAMIGTGVGLAAGYFELSRCTSGHEIPCGVGSGDVIMLFAACGTVAGAIVGALWPTRH